MQIKNLICTVRPINCRLTLKIDNISVSGNQCSKLNSYRKEKAVCSMRIFTTTLTASIKEIPILSRNMIIKNFAENGACLITSGGLE